MSQVPGDGIPGRRTRLTHMSTNVTYPIVIEEQDGEFVAYVPALDFASTHGDTRDEALDRTRELILGFLEFAEKEGLAVPVPASHTELAEVTVPRS
jgi:predicted RNase H-like HicB family nuclease